MEKAVISAGRIVTIPYSGKLFSLHLDGLLTQELCDDLTDSEDWEYVWESLVSCLDMLSIHFYSRPNAVTLMITRLEAISSIPSVGKGKIEDVRYQCTLHDRFPVRPQTYSELNYIATVGIEALGRPRTLKVASYGETAVEAVCDFALREAHHNDGAEWLAAFSKKERDFQGLLGDTDMETDDLGYTTYTCGQAKVTLPTLRNRSFSIRKRSTALYHRMCQNKWCSITIVRIVESSPSVPEPEPSDSPSEQGDVGLTVPVRTDSRSQDWIRDAAESVAVYVAGVLRDGERRNGIRTNDSHTNGVQTHSTRTPGGNTNSAHAGCTPMVGALTSGAQTNGAHTPDPHAIHPHTIDADAAHPHTIEPRKSDAHMVDPHTIDPHKDDAHTFRPHTVDPHTTDPLTGDLHAIDPQTNDPLIDFATPNDTHASGLHPNGTRTNGPRTDGRRMNGTPTRGPGTDGTHTDCDFANRMRTSGYKRRRGDE